MDEPFVAAKRTYGLILEFKVVLETEIKEL